MALLNTSKAKAIEILEKRLADLNQYSIEDKIWCSRTSHDIKSIFNGLDGVTRAHEIERLTHAISGTWKNTGRGYLNSYIDFINDHIPDEDTTLKNDTSLLLTQLKQQNTEYIQENMQLSNQLCEQKLQIAQYSLLVAGYQNTIIQKTEEIKNLQESIWQIDGVNISKLWQIFLSLKLKEQLAIITAVLTIIGLSFFCGQHFFAVVDDIKKK